MHAWPRIAVKGISRHKLRFVPFFIISGVQHFASKSGQVLKKCPAFTHCFKNFVPLFRGGSRNFVRWDTKNWHVKIF